MPVLSIAWDCPRARAVMRRLSGPPGARTWGGGLEVKVAVLEDIMVMKKAAGRPKDLIELEILGKLREEIEARERGRPT